MKIGMPFVNCFIYTLKKNKKIKGKIFMHFEMYDLSIRDLCFY